MTSKPDSAKKPAASTMPKCPICGRRSTVKRSSDGLFLCQHCQEQFRA